VFQILRAWKCVHVLFFVLTQVLDISPPTVATFMRTHTHTHNLLLYSERQAETIQQNVKYRRFSSAKKKQK